MPASDFPRQNTLLHVRRALVTCMRCAPPRSSAPAERARKDKEDTRAPTSGQTCAGQWFLCDHARPPRAHCGSGGKSLEALLHLERLARSRTRPPLVQRSWPWPPPPHQRKSAHRQPPPQPPPRAQPPHHKSVVCSTLGNSGAVLSSATGPLHTRVRRVVAFWAAHQALKALARADRVCSNLASSAVRLRPASAPVQLHSSAAASGHTQAICGRAPALAPGPAAAAGMAAGPRSAGAGPSALAAAKSKKQLSGRRAMTAGARSRDGPSDAPPAAQGNCERGGFQPEWP